MRTDLRGSFRRFPRPLRGGLAAALVTLGNFLPAQLPPGPPVLTLPPPGVPTQGRRESMDTRLELGRRILASSGAKAARHHFFEALAVAPRDARALLELARIAEKRPEERWVWSYLYLLSRANKNGRLSLDKSERAILSQGLPSLQTLVQKRAAAFHELLSFVRLLPRKGAKSLGNGILARWALDLLLEIAEPSPALRRELAAKAPALLQGIQPKRKMVLDALAQLAMKAKLNKDTQAKDVARPLRAAELLTGLAAQAHFPKLKGPRPPKMDAYAKKGRAARDRIRAALLKSAGEPLSLSDLRAMDLEQQREFSLLHRFWERPGIALTPGKKYLCQTTCGYETLLGLVETAELHHRRLANWYGKDPFVYRQGSIFVVPDTADLESEGSPFWWAGGFQAGDQTRLKFSWGSISGLGRSLTHELTHRFDGAIYPGLPSWLSEGRAVWTAKSYGAAEDEHFDELRLDPWTVQTPFVRGYGGRGKFERLLKGTIEDYRDNYTAGYALFAFLKLWPNEKGDKPLFARKLGIYLKNIREGRRDPVGFFERSFADGRAGRPKKMPEFLKLWHSFLQACYKYCWGEKVPALARFHLRGKGGKRRSQVEDQPTWTWEHPRAEPWFGQIHAARAAKLLQETGAHKAAAAAACWALTTDAYDRETWQRAWDLLETLGKKREAWALARLIARRDSLSRIKAGSSPLLAALPKTRAWLRAEAGVPGIRWQRHLPEPAASLARRLGTDGWIETGLTGYEERRVRGLWFEEDDGDLHVGRARPRDKSGLKDRRAHQRHAFVRSLLWLPAGSYRLQTWVQPTTSFASGAIVVGYTRRDRGVRVYFSTGDFLFSIGKREESDKKRQKEISFSLSGGWGRESQFPGSRPRKKLKFPSSVDGFNLEIRVRGPELSLWINGEKTLHYLSPDLSPIQGHIGFAMGQGAIRLRDPRVTIQSVGATPPPGLKLLAPLKGTPLLGSLVLDLPRASSGSVVLTLPPKKDPKLKQDPLQMLLQKTKAFARRRVLHPQPILVLLPKSWDAKTKAFAKERCQSLHKDILFFEYEGEAPLDKRPWALFLDGNSVVREARPFSPKRGFPGRVETWARKYRARKKNS
ncbi:MAG TPA: hypothetical protein ENK02_13580 [Planctomycetes bacterium]|nr:hypothetical protein [Planctomycetota bacterium]